MLRFSRILVMVAMVLVTLTAQVYAQSFAPVQKDAGLQSSVDEAVRGFHGVCGVYVRSLATGQGAEFNADSLFPTASMVKVTILCGIMNRIEKGELKFDSVVVYRDSMKYDDGPTGSLKDSSRVPIGELVHLMLSLSDNTASLWLQRLAGGGTAINAWLEENGFRNLRVNSRTPGREHNRDEYGWGQTTPREMAELITRIRNGKAVSPAASERMYRALGRSYWDGESLSQLPPTVHVVSKQGAVDEAKSEVLLVNAPSGDYVVCVTTKNQTDQRWMHDNEGYVLLRKVAKLVWDHFEPARPFKTALDDPRYSP